jgi:YVTN family beta-propeller protein
MLNSGTISSQVPNSPVVTGASPQSVVVDPSGRFVYLVNNTNPGTIVNYPINPTTGGLPGVVVATNTGMFPVSVIVDPTGQFAYVANSGSNSVSGFTIDSGTGNLSQIGVGPTSVGTTPQSVAVDQSGQFLYVVTAGTVPGRIAAFKIQAGGGQDGQLAAVGLPINTGLTPVNIAIDPSGKWVFVTNSGDGTLSVYRIDGTTGTLTLVSAPIPVGNKPDGVTVDPSGKFVYVTIWGPDPPAPAAPGVVAYTLDPGTGLLTLVNTFAVGTQPTAVQTTGTIQ